MKMILYFLCLLTIPFFQPIVSAADSIVEGTVVESVCTLRKLYDQYSDRDYGWSYTWHLEMEYDLVFDNGRTLSVRLLHNAAAQPNSPIPQLLQEEYDYAILPGDVLIFSDLFTLHRNKYHSIIGFWMRIKDSHIMLSGYSKAGNFFELI